MNSRQEEWYSRIYGLTRNRTTMEPEVGNTYFFVQHAITEYFGESGSAKWVGTILGTTYNGDHVGDTRDMGYGKYKLFLNEYAPVGIEDGDRVVKLRDYRNGFGGRARYYNPGDIITFDPEIDGSMGYLIPNYVAPQGNRRIGTRRFPVVATPAPEAEAAAAAEEEVEPLAPQTGDLQVGERVEVIQMRVNDTDPDLWVPGIIEAFDEFYVLNIVSNFMYPKRPADVRDPITRVANNINLPIGWGVDIKVGGRWVRGVILDKIYRVRYTNIQGTGETVQSLKSRQRLRRPGEQNAYRPLMPITFRAQQQVEAFYDGEWKSATVWSIDNFIENQGLYRCQVRGIAGAGNLGQTIYLAPNLLRLRGQEPTPAPAPPTQAQETARRRIVDAARLPPPPPPANRPYRDGERVEAEINGNWVNGTFRGHASRSVDDHGFMINVNGREQYFEPSRVRRPGGQPIIPVPDSDSDSDSDSESEEEEEQGAYRVGEEVEAMYGTNWRHGTFRGYRNGRLLVNIVSGTRSREVEFNENQVRRVQEEEEEGHFLDSDQEDSEEEEAPAPPLTQRRGQRGTLRQRMTAQAQAQAPVRPPPPPPIGPGGVAFEIHNAFDNFKIDEFMGIINTSIGRSTNFKNREAPLQPLIDNIRANASLSAGKKRELTQKITRIFDTLKEYSNYREKLGNITACIQYVLMQPQDFIDTYINTFITDCLKAYSSGNTQSCIKGMYERIYFAFRDTVSTICLDQIQGTGAAPNCKPEYIQIFDCFYENIPTEMLNEYLKEWFQERSNVAENMTERQRINNFVGFVREKINNSAKFTKAEASIRRYADQNLNVLFGGKRSNSKKRVKKTIKKRLNKQRNRKTKKH